ncbi:MAG TPA: FtsX-like permease family protein [candidate division Zixibacteria bacterium]|nr:FtsX-like permease family protein [candidate division Zixibacteria bacterium]
MLEIKKTADLKVMFSFLKANKSSLVLKIVALTLVTIAIASSFFFFDSFQPQFAVNYMNDNRAEQSDIALSWDFSYEDYLGNNSGSIDDYVFANDLGTELATQLGTYLGNNSISNVYSQESSYAFSFGKEDNLTFTLVNANNFNLELLDEYSIEQNSSIDLLEGGVLVLEQSVVDYSSSEASLLNESKILLGDGQTDISLSNYTIDFHSKVVWDIQDTVLSNKIEKIIGATDFAIVVSDDIFEEYLQFIKTTSSIFDISAAIYFDLDYSEISFDDSALLQDQLSQFIFLAQNFVLDEFSIDADLSFETFFLSLLSNLEDVIFIIQTLILVFTIPTILFSLLILYFSNEYFTAKRSKLFSFYYSKGSSTQQLFFFVFAEFLISTISALITGIGLSVPFTLLMIKNPNFGFVHDSASQLNFPLNISYINILWISLIVVAIGLLVILNNIKPIFSLSNDNKTLESDDTAVPSKVIWKNLYFDFLLLLAGVSILLIEKALFQVVHDFSTQFFVFFIGVLVIIFALALILLRTLPGILSSIGNYLWKSFGNISSFATRLFNVRKKILVKNMVTFALCISYILVLIQAVSAVNQFSTEQAYFSVGADARIDFSDDSNITAITSALPSSIQYSEITKFHLRNFLTGERLVFLVIDPNTFLSTAYFKDNYLDDKSSSEVIGKIDHNLTILSQQEIAESKSWYLGYNYSITLSYGSTDRLSLEIVDYFNSWPFFMNDNQQVEGIPLIIGKETYDVLKNNGTDFSNHLLLDISDFENYAQIMNNLETEVLTPKETLVCIEDGYDQFWSEPFWYIMNTFAVINLYLISLLFVVLIVITIITLENNRKAETGMFLALGIRKKQIFLLSLIEQLTVLIPGLLLGIAIGLPSSIFLNNQLKNNFPIPIGSLGVFWIVGFILLGIFLFNLILVIGSVFRTSSRKVAFFIQELELNNESYD